MQSYSFFVKISILEESFLFYLSFSSENLCIINKYRIFELNKSMKNQLLTNFYDELEQKHQ